MTLTSLNNAKRPTSAGMVAHLAGIGNLANEHASLQVGRWEDSPFELQTVIDNVSLITPELWRKINEVIVGVGLEVVGKKSDDDLKHGVIRSR